MSIPQTLTPRSHNAKLDLHQNQLRLVAKQKLSERLEERFCSIKSDCAFLVTGSDARNESIGVGRPIDLIFIHKPVGASLAGSFPIPTPEPRADTPGLNSPLQIQSQNLLKQTPFETDTPTNPYDVSHLPSASDSFHNLSFGSLLSESIERTTPLQPVPESPTKREKSYSPEFLPIVEKVRQAIAEYPALFSPALDVYIVGSSRSPFKCEYPKGSVTIPNLALDACFLIGNPSLAKEYRLISLLHLKKMNYEDRRDFKKHFWTPSITNLNQCMDGIEKQPVSFATGLLTFDNHRMMSTKHILLRPVQYHLMYLYMHAVRNSEKSPEEMEDLADGMPPKIVDRIQWMHSLGMLPAMTQENVTELSNAYDLALQWYEQSQLAFEKEMKTEVIVDLKELQRVARIIQSFVLNNTPEATNTPPRKRDSTKVLLP